MKLTDWYDEQLERIEQGKASDRAIAELTGMTVEEFDADTTQPDSCEKADAGLDIEHDWERIQDALDGYCPVCGTSINQYEVICDDCLDRAQAHQLHGPPVAWR